MLDLDCKAHEVDNLYVTDASFFPSIGAVNPTLTIIANALRVADHLKRASRRMTRRGRDPCGPLPAGGAVLPVQRPRQDPEFSRRGRPGAAGVLGAADGRGRLSRSASAVEMLMPLAILTGMADRLAAFIMAGYCGVTALLWKQFWGPGDFWAHGDSKARDLFWDFLKNFSLAGGFLLLTFGVNGAGRLAFLADPVASSHPYIAP